MNDSEVYEKVDLILQEALTKLTIKDYYAALLNTIGEHNDNFKNNFPVALDKGELGEEIVKQYLESLGYTFVSKNNTIEYDLKFLYKGREITVEVKTDTKHLNEKGEDTENLAVEYESRGKASGISVITANFFIMFFPKIHEVWRVRTEVLKRFIEENKHNKDLIKDFKSGGDKGSNTHMYLLKRTQDEVKKIFTVTNLKDVLV